MGLNGFMMIFNLFADSMKKEHFDVCKVYQSNQ